MSLPSSTIPAKVVWADHMYLSAFALARQGHDDESIALSLGVRFHVLVRWTKSRPDLKDAIQRGRAEADQEDRALDVSRIRLTTQRRFLAAYAICGNVTRAASNSGTHRESHYRWMEEKEYAKVFAHAHAESIDALEDEARRRAVAGCRQYKFNNGRPIMVRCELNDPDFSHTVEGPNGESWPVKHYAEIQYSDTLLILLLKSERPNKYRDKPVEVKGGDTNVHVGIDLNSMLKASEKVNIIDVDSVEVVARKAIANHRSEGDD